MKTFSEWSVKIALTSNCNYSCFYCNDSLIQAQKKRLDYDKVSAFLKAAANLGITREIHWTGGECTLENLEAYMQLAHVLGFKKQAITSNGLLIDKHMDAFIKYNLERANLSIDSLDNQKYLEITGIDGLDKVLENTRKLLDNNIKVKFNVVLMRRNVDEVLDFIEYTKHNNITLKIHELWNYGDESQFHKEYIDIHSIELSIKQLGYDIDEIPVDLPTIKYFKKGDHNIGLLSSPKKGICNSRFCKQIKLYADGTTCEGCRINNYSNLDFLLSDLMNSRRLGEIKWGDKEHEADL
ncbi:radical SAM protein [Parasphaerochaeta coccoides]|uniref:Radical SAM domain protein n=1 Tax=Parasphaerochaeta coccoides (strain ATCC BAA-1237 / DSM 17374 / SPN1) TaxID=760011 RepID=F4GID1_PARC1|nr:radical SAM protein [Parasphaerochaeta coccoides]AEC01639.1 Radical SAM domain protein [Parasphaerochaeta coccoides DSM 17374]